MWNEWRPKIEPPIRISIIPTTTLNPTMSLMRMGHRTMTTSLSYGWAGLEVASDPEHGRALTRPAYTTSRPTAQTDSAGLLHPCTLPPCPESVVSTRDQQFVGTSPWNPRHFSGSGGNAFSRGFSPLS